MRLSRKRLPGWLLSVALSLAGCFALWWWFLRDPLVILLAQAAALVSPYLWPEAVLDIKIRDHQAWIISMVPTLSEPPQLFTVMPLVLSRAVAIFPLFWGLTLATPGRGLLRRLLLGTFYLLPVALVMALLTTQFQFALYRTHLPMVTLVPPPHFVMDLPDSPLVYYAWGVGRQFATLILPLVAPLLVWLSFHERFLRNFFPQGLRLRPSSPLSPSPSPSPVMASPQPSPSSAPASLVPEGLVGPPVPSATEPMSATSLASAGFPPPSTPFVPAVLPVTFEGPLPHSATVSLASSTQAEVQAAPDREPPA